jgi:hypothetical protein
MSSPRSMTRYTVDTSRPGRSRVVAISLPLIPQLLDERAYRPPSQREHELPGERHGGNFTKWARRALGKDRSTARRVAKGGDAITFAATLKRISEVGR